MEKKIKERDRADRMKRPRALARRMLNLVPKNKFLYALCKKYTRLYNGENNCDIETNGERRFLKKILPRCSIIFDVGANKGEWAKSALRINPRIRLYCFEPSSFSFNKLTANNFGPNVICSNIAMGSKEEEARLLLFNEGSGLNTFYPRRISAAGGGIKTQAGSETVRVATLDGFCRENGVGEIDLLKLDIEGSELEALKGAAYLFMDKKIKMVQFEYGGTFIDARILLKDIFEYLAGYGYSVFKIFPDRLMPIKGYDHKLENFQYANYAAILKGFDYAA